MRVAWCMLLLVGSMASMPPSNDQGDPNGSPDSNSIPAGSASVLVAPEWPGNTPNAFDPWGSPPPLNPFEASPYMPHPTLLTKLPQPYYHPLAGPLYQAAQMHMTPGFLPFSPRQFSAFYDPINSPASQGLFHPALNPLGLNIPTGDMRPMFGLMAHNPKAYTALTSPGVATAHAMQQIQPTFNWVAPGGY